MVYLAGNVIGFIVWAVLFYLRKDLRKEMLIMSFLTAPLALFDFLLVPTYWVPQTFLHIPIGLEGLLYGFQFGGITAVAYEFFTRKKLVPIKSYHPPYLIIFLSILALPLGVVLANSLQLNIVFGLYFVGFLGLILIALKRHDLWQSMIDGALIYGAIYFLCLFVWFHFFPQATDWFRLEGLPKVFILGVPVYEIIFGLLQGAYWGNVYELLFGYTYKKGSGK